MIIEGHPELGLQEHQQEAYKAITESYKRQNKAAVVLPTGCGKSFISLQLMQDNKDKKMLFLAPTNAIKDQMYRYIAKYIANENPTSERPAKMVTEEVFPGLKIMTYPALLRIKEETMPKLEADLIIMDELHRTGAEQWGEKINNLLEINPKAKLLGVTATPDRADNIDVVDNLFSGNIVYELSLVDAIRRRIVKAPDYVKCDYALGEMLEHVEAKIASVNDEEKKKELENIYNKMRRIVDKAEGIPELFEKNMKKKDGKYIVFCKDKEQMEEAMESAKTWFANIDAKPEIYSVYSKYGKNNNAREIKQFEESKSEHLKLLFSVEMLNEGLHVEDISGAIMLRPTDSRIIYLQQLGRTLSSDTTRERTIVFDLVNNYLKNNLDRELNPEKQTKTIEENANRTERNNWTENSGRFDEDEDIGIFRIQGETKEFLELLGYIENICQKSTYLQNAREIYEWFKNNGETKLPSSTAKNKIEKKLGQKLNNIRHQLIKPYLVLKTEEEKAQYREKYSEFEEVMKIIEEMDTKKVSIHLRNAREIYDWFKNNGETKLPVAKAEDAIERKLGKKLEYIKAKLIKPYLILKTEEEKAQYREKHPEIEEVMKIIRDMKEKKTPIYLQNAREIYEWVKNNGKTKLPSTNADDETERKLGQKLNNIRHQLIKPYLVLKTEEEKAQYREKYSGFEEVMKIIEEMDIKKVPIHLQYAREIHEWVKNNGETKLPSTNADNNSERNLAKKLDRIRQNLIKPYLILKTEEEKAKYREKHQEIEEVMKIIEEMDTKKVPKLLKYTREIHEWFKNNGETKLPSTNADDEIEKKLGQKLHTIRHILIKPYLRLETEEEKVKYKEKHSEIEEVMKIIEEMDTKKIPIHLQNARDIYEWYINNGETKLPSQSGKDEIEKKLGQKLNTIRNQLIKQYLSLSTEEEKAQYREKHPRVEEVIQIMKDLDEKVKENKKTGLTILVKECLTKKEKLKKAKILKYTYSKQLVKKKQKQAKGENKWKTINL